MTRFLRIYLILLFLSGCCLTAAAQSMNVEDYTSFKGKKPFKLSGGVSAVGTWYDASEMFGRQPYTWQLNGNLNINIYGLLDIPLSFGLNNFGSQYTYPSLPNRLSIHPKYKWITAHIGDVAMTFSPYTLNGHQFTGGGVELTPGKWNIMAMGGQLMRGVGYNPAIPSIPPTYDRWGAGAKVRYNGSKFFAGASVFAAKDTYKTVSFQADSMGIFPKNNVTTSIEGGVNITSNLKLSAEYAISVFNRDTRPIVTAEENNQATTQKTVPDYYHALRASLDYTFWKNTIGIGYERIDPGYETLGAYYFNNDYENITANYARPLFGGKANIALSGGFQRDDLDGSKNSDNVRVVGSANLSYNPTDKVNMALSYSTFQGYRLIKSQFDYINQTTPYENLDTLNFTQISNNLDFNFNWTFQSNERTTQGIMFYTSYQEAADRQGGYILPGNLSRFLNASTAYTLEIAAINTGFNLGLSVSNNYSAQTNFLTLGPMFAATVKLLKKKLITGASVSWNRSAQENIPVADVLNCRWNASMRIAKRHSLQASAMYQHQKRTAQAITKTTYSTTAQLGYAYSF